jgi:hypothetical protein
MIIMSIMWPRACEALSRLATRLKAPRYCDDLNGSDHGWKMVSGRATSTKCPGPPSIPGVEGERLLERRCGFGKFFPAKARGDDAVRVV